MAAKTIFPGLTADAENTILNQMASWPDVLVNMSGTHRFAYQQLSNRKYFLELFAKQHPLLARIDRLFFQLKTDYPERCWKVACCTMLKDYRLPAKKFTGMSPYACLLIDQYFARNAVGFMKEERQLRLINSIFDHIFLSPPPHVQDYLLFFKEKLHASKQCNLILEILYHMCANGVHEPEWAEKHLFKFPHQLKRILVRLSSLAIDFKKVCFDNSDLFLKCFVDENFPVMKGQLFYLRQFRDSLQLQLDLGKEDYTLSPEQLTALRDGVGTLIFELASPPREVVNNLDDLNVLNLRDSLPLLSSLIRHIESYEEQG